MEIYPPQAQANNHDGDMEFEASDFITPNRTRTPRRQFTPGFKADIIRRIEKGESVKNVAVELKLDISNIYRWIEKKRALFQNEVQVSPRLMVNSKGAKYPQIDSELFDFVVDHRNRKLGVTTRMVNIKALELAQTYIEDEEERKKFKASTTYITNFMRRHEFSYRKATHVSQYKIRDFNSVKNSLVNYLARLRKFLSEFPHLEYILQCDETPVYFDMLNPRTIEFKGSKSVDLITTGQTKTRFTVLLTIAAHGLVLKGYVVFRGLKNVPNCRIPDNITVSVSDSGSMNKHLMLDYLRRVVDPYMREMSLGYGRNGALVMDAFIAYFVEEVVDYMEEIII
jgi:hypothetical protein